MPPFKGSDDKDGPETYFIFLSNQDKNFKQIPIAKRKTIQHETNKGWGIVLSRNENNVYVYWCNNHQQPHKKIWQIQKAPDQLPMIEIGSEL